MNDALKIFGFAALTLSVRVLTWFALAGGMGLFIYAVLFPDIQRTGAACGYALLVFLPALWSEKKQNRGAARTVAQIQRLNGSEQQTEAREYE